jgi:hypothetical protein
MQPHQERVVAEKAELDFRLSSLTAFIHAAFFQSLPYDERARLTTQQQIMVQYSAVLGARIAAFHD